MVNVKVNRKKVLALSDSKVMSLQKQKGRESEGLTGPLLPPREARNSPAEGSRPGQPRVRREEGHWGFGIDAPSPLPPSASPSAGPEVVTSAGVCALNPGQLLPRGLQLRAAGKPWAPSPPPTEGSGLCPPPLSATWPSAPRRRPGGAKRTRGPRLPPG